MILSGMFGSFDTAFMQQQRLIDKARQLQREGVLKASKASYNAHKVIPESNRINAPDVIEGECEVIEE